MLAAHNHCCCLNISCGIVQGPLCQDSTTQCCLWKRRSTWAGFLSLLAYSLCNTDGSNAPGLGADDIHKSSTLYAIVQEILRYLQLCHFQNQRHNQSWRNNQSVTWAKKREGHCLILGEASRAAAGYALVSVFRRSGASQSL